MSEPPAALTAASSGKAWVGDREPPQQSLATPGGEASWPGHPHEPPAQVGQAPRRGARSPGAPVMRNVKDNRGTRPTKSRPQRELGRGKQQAPWTVVATPK